MLLGRVRRRRFFFPSVDTNGDTNGEWIVVGHGWSWVVMGGGPPLILGSLGSMSSAQRLEKSLMDF